MRPTLQSQILSSYACTRARTAPSDIIVSTIKGNSRAIVFAETLLLLIELADQITENDCAVTGH
jgi:hypothetical protein